MRLTLKSMNDPPMIELEGRYQGKLYNKITTRFKMPKNEQLVHSSPSSTLKCTEVAGTHRATKTTMSMYITDMAQNHNTVHVHVK